jgi:hypothetical protein
VVPHAVAATGSGKFGEEHSGQRDFVKLVRHCFSNVEVSERKHQVSVLRAAHKVVAADPDWVAKRMGHQGGGWVFFNHANVQSYALSGLISDRTSHDIYHTNGPVH